jgi:hypothetical protein
MTAETYITTPATGHRAHTHRCPRAVRCMRVPLPKAITKRVPATMLSATMHYVVQFISSHNFFDAKKPFFLNFLFI